tara:strand:+ start:1978 stop:2940 length:963 start_codon:yes stop_codon:yes gene_type:complete
MFLNTTKKKNQEFNTPILLIIFNRPQYIKKILEVLKKTKPQTLYIAADGPRTEVEADIINCTMVKELILKNIDWDCKVFKKFRSKNIGLKKNINDAIDWCFEYEQNCIILEDDCLPDESFFKFCQFALHEYEDNKKIKIISGNYYMEHIVTKNSFYFSRCPGTHGWAIWKDRWQENDKKMSDWKGFREFFWLFYFFKFNFSIAHFFYQKFKLSFYGKINSWDYQLLYSIWKKDGLIIRPYKNLCKHIGWGADSTHGKGNDTFPGLNISKMKFPIVIPPEITINEKLDSLEHKLVRKIYFFRYFLRLIKFNVMKIFNRHHH